MKNTSRYASGLVCGVPIAPMTSGAQPCMPAAPFGAEDARTSLRTMAGRTSAICWATKLPMEKPSRSTWPSSSAARNAMASRAICSMVSAVAAGGAADSGVVERHDPPRLRQRVDQRRVPVVEIAAEVLEQDQRHRTLAAAGVAAGIVDTVGGTD